MIKLARAAFKAAVNSLNLAEELWIASLTGAGGTSDTSTGAEIYYNRARCFYSMELWGDTIKDLNKVDEIRPGHVPSLMLRGNARIRLGQYPQVSEEKNRRTWRAPKDLYAPSPSLLGRWKNSTALHLLA